MKASDAAHVIDGILTRQLMQEHRIAVLDFVRAGYDGETGKFVGRTEDQQIAIHCCDCGSPLCEHCDVRNGT